MPELTTWLTVRAAIMELRSRLLKIDTATKQVISELGLSRRQRGCRAGRHKRRGRPKFSACLQLSHSTACNDVTSGIPVVAGYRPPRKHKHNTDTRSSTVTDVHITELIADQHQPYVPCMFTANIRGAFALKVDELSTVLQQNNVDVACITETFLNECVPSEILHIPGYIMHRNDRKNGRRCGGVAVLVQQDIQCQRLTSLECTDVETLWMLYRLPRMPRCLSHVVIGAVYNPPSADCRKMTTHILSCLDKVTRDHPYAGIIVLGDFNRLPDAALISYPLKQVVKAPTRQSAILDKIYTNLQDWYERPVVLPNVGRSDHRAVVMSAAINVKRERGCDITVVKRSEDPNGKAFLAQAMQNLDWTPLYTMSSCEEMTSCFYNTVTSLIDQHLPQITVKRHTTDKPWITDQFRRLIRCRQNALTSGDMARYRRLRNHVQRLARQLRRKYYKRKANGLRHSNPRNWWRAVKQFTGMNPKSTEPLESLAQQLYDGDVQRLADHINKFFQQVAADLCPLSDSVTMSQLQSTPSEFVIDQTAVERKLSQINVCKAPGPDGLPNWLLRDFCSPLSGPVCAIFNASVREGSVPSRWKEANVIAVPKAHPPRLIESDLRPISLTPTLSKLLESFVGEWILDKIQGELDPHQYGAIKGRSTTHALIDMTHHWNKAVDEGQSVRAVFIDFAKAFDHVDHNVLLEKFMEFNLPDTIVQWMCSFLRHRRQRVKIGSVMSDWVEMDAGMPQGSYLGPLTFIMLVDKLQTSCLIHKFVDDTTLSEIIAKSATSYMQERCNELVEQSQEARMIVNGRKTKEMIIGPILKDPPPDLLLNDTVVDRVTTFKLLGVYVSNDLKWTEHVRAVTTKASSRLHFLKQLKRAGCAEGDLLYFYTSVVRPILEYACPVWHTGLTAAQSDALESLQRRAMRIIYSDDNSGDYKTRIIIAGVDTLKDRREVLTERLFKRHVLPSSSLLHYLLPDRRDNDTVNSLRHSQPFHKLRTRTTRFRNCFIPYCLNTYM